MKTWIKFFASSALAMLAATALQAQNSNPLVTASITEVDVFGNSVSTLQVTAGGSGYSSAPTVVMNGTGTGASAFATLSVNAITLTAGGSGYLSTPTVTLTGGGGSGATAAASVTGGVVTSISLLSAGTGYTTMPIVNISGGGGSGATAGATGSLSGLSLISGGTGYVTPPTLTLTTLGTGTGATGVAFLPISARFLPPAQNESFGPAGNSIDIFGQAIGTIPAGGYTYQFFVNGVSIGTAIKDPINNPNGNGITWTPPEPGFYFLSVQASGGPVVAISQSFRYFATGTSIVNPVPNTIVPNGSSVVIQATATPAPFSNGADAFVQRIDFYADGLLIGSDTTAPYSIIYTPAASPSPHTIEARAYDNLGGQISPNGTATQQLFMVTPIGTPPSAVMSSPVNASSIPIGNAVTVVVDAHSPSGLIQKVELYIDGVLFATNSSFPYTFSWSPSIVGTYRLVALAYDDKNNVIATTTSTSPSSTPAPTVITIAAPPSITITSPTNGTTIPGGGSGQITASATDSNLDSKGNPVTIVGVQFYVDGVAVGGPVTVPNKDGFGNVTTSYSTSFVPVPKSTPTLLTALATDSLGISFLSAAVSVSIDTGGSGGPTNVIGAPPVVSITAPVGGTQVTVGNPVTVSASASDPDGTIASVQFFANTTAIATVSGFPYNTTWTPVALGTYNLTAKATDNSGNVVTSAIVTVTVLANGAPFVSLTSPSTGSTIAAGTPVTVSASASDFDGTVTAVLFKANGIVIGSVSAAPYKVIWTPSASGTYTITAQATDNSGNITVTPAVTVTVGGNQPPLVSLTSPSVGTGVQIGNSVTLTATASDPDGVVSSVQFFASGVPIGTAKTTPPYTVAWTPTAEGVYQLTAVATDNAFATTTSNAVAVIVFTATGATSSSIYTGNYQAGFEAGKVALMAFGGTTVTLIAHSTNTTTAAAKTYFFPDVPLDSAGNFSVTTGALVLSGVVSGGSATGTITGLPSMLLFIANTPVVPSTSTAFPASGYFSGNLTGRPSSSVAAIVGPDSSIMLYLKDGTFVDAGDGKVSSTGAFTVVTSEGNTVTGTIDPTSGFLNATVSGSTTASVTAALASGGIFSDGSLRNLSTRGQVGTGANVLITGFVIGGTAPKNVLIRAIGPTLSTLGITSPLSDPQLQVYNSVGTAIPGASNNNWSGSAADAATMASVGAFALPVGSKDSVLITSLPAGVYSTQVSGVGGTTGVALVEFYDLDSPSPFSTQKVMNVSTRGLVGTGQNILIAGFVINGTAPKKVLIRAMGPGLAGLGVSGTLADPFLSVQRLVGTNATVVRENDNWETGNDPSLVVAAAAEVGAFPLVSGSKDAVILATLPPGTYSAQVTGVGATTGIALVEVYEVP